LYDVVNCDKASRGQHCLNLKYLHAVKKRQAMMMIWHRLPMALFTQGYTSCATLQDKMKTLGLA
jgi:hypothetical protein